jgi:biotin carboxyl carrier protein
MVGERIYISEKVITSPADGVFEHLDDDLVNKQIAAGQIIGIVKGPNSNTEINSTFAGQLKEFTVAPGERVRKHESIARVTTEIVEEDVPETPELDEGVTL